MNARAARRSTLRAGRIGRAHGLDGSFYVLEPNLPLLGEGQRLILGEREMVVEQRRGTDDRPIVRLEGLGDRTAVESLRHQLLLASRDHAPDLPDGEWWAEDLEGCTVLAAGREIGIVKRLIGFPSCEALQVERAGRGEELLVPLVLDAVPQVDVERREIEIDLEFLGAGQT